MMCDRCDRPLTPGAGETVPIHGASGSGGTVTVHRAGCTPAPRPPSYPQGRRG